MLGSTPLFFRVSFSCHLLMQQEERSIPGRPGTTTGNCQSPMYRTCNAAPEKVPGAIERGDAGDDNAMTRCSSTAKKRQNRALRYPVLPIQSPGRMYHQLQELSPKEQD